MRFRPELALLALSLLPGGVAIMRPGNPSNPSPAKPEFATHVVPIFRATCNQCHNGQNASGGLRLDTPAGIRKGGVSGPLFRGNDPSKSLLMERILGHGGKPRMPMGFAPLSDAQTGSIRSWIVAGTPMAGGAKPHWAYVAPTRPTVPPVKDKAWGRNAIDAFVLARLEAKGIRPNPPASREMILRRVSLDLTGLPPTLEEIDAFLADTRPDAYERVVDRLLASPHYGERMAQPWLDLARYADTNGYEADFTRSMWPYRDWVIKAFNADMPFDDFTRKQLAGDLLPNPTLDDLVATGFNRNTMLNQEGGVDQAEARWLTLVDRVATTSQTWLGSTLQCAQCHDHKYDPFSQEDYFRLFAYFEPSEEPSIELPSEAVAKRRTELKAQIEQASDAKRKADLQNELDGLRGPTTLILREKKGVPVPTTRLRLRGAYLSPAQLLHANVPRVLNPLPKGVPNNRRGLAEWLLDRSNPLTTRVVANRLWEQHFGTGIVATSEDFGTQGERPSHPELLDWLATELPRRGWSLKQMHRLIVTSATYRQSSAAPASKRELDPANRLLSRGPRFRLDAELIRDHTLSVGGLLSLKMGGPSVFPGQPAGIWDSPYSGERWNDSQGEDRYRRGVYTFWKRTATYPMFTNFDATSRESCTVRRIRTNTPLQALNMMNDPVVIEASQSLGRKMLQRPGDLRAQLAYGFRRATSRRPKPAELTQLESLYAKARQRYVNNPDAAKKLGDSAEAAAFTIVGNVLLNLDETLTKS